MAHVCRMHRTVPCIPLSVNVTPASAKTWPKDTPACASVLTHQEGEAPTMGRTVPTYRSVLEALISDWQGFRMALRKEDQAAFDRLMDKARRLASAAGYDPRLDPMESVFMSILVELEKEFEELRKKVEELEKRDTQ
jgi:hypothetical protein